jgi:hypothetical protein
MANQTGQARGNLMRLEQQLHQSKGNLRSATRNRIVGGVILVLGIIALIQFNVAIGVVGLLIGGWVFIKALLTVGQQRRSVDSITDRVTHASDRLDELQAQPDVAD